MKTTLTIFAVLLLLAAQPTAARAGWGPAGCATVVAHVTRQPAATYQWRRSEKHPEEAHLYLGSKLVGGYSFSTGFYHPNDNDTWGAATVAPVRPPFGTLSGAEHANRFGLDSSGLTGTERVWDSQKTYTFEELKADLAAGLVDDSKTSHLTPIVKGKERKKEIEKTWEAAQAQRPDLQKVRFQAYDFSDPVSRFMLAPFQLERDERFKEKGETVIVQGPALTPEGSSRARASQDTGRPENMIEGLRIIDPAFDPNQIYAPSLPGLPSVNWELVILGGALIFLLAFGSRFTSH